MRRLAALLLGFAAAANAASYVQAVEFPYYLYPRQLWERELVWLKNIGIQTIEFPIPREYHELPGGGADLTGASSPRRDLVGFVRILRRLGLQGWARPSAGPEAWHKQLDQILATQTTAHGGPIAFVEAPGTSLHLPPPAPVVAVTGTDASAFARSRAAIAASRGTLLWIDVEDSLYPAGWTADAQAPLHRGAVALNGDERGTTSALRRDAALLRGWIGLLGEMKRIMPDPRSAVGKLPDSVSAVQLGSPVAGAVSILNRGATPFHDDVRVMDPATKKTLVIPNVTVPAGQALWLPLRVSLGPEGLCRECTNFSGDEHIVYATAELFSVEFENGLLAMEFAAPQAGEVILQLARRPVGPYLAAGKPADFDWDEHNLRVRLAIPAGKQPGNRVRIGLAIEAPETSAFFNELRRLVIGRKNAVSTIYSSADVAARSRLRLPEGYTATATKRSPNEIDYEVFVPADALHGDYASLVLEADGVALGRARVQLFRPASVQLVQAIPLHFGDTELMPDPATAAIDPRGAANLELSVRNNSAQIQTYRLEFAGEGLEFFPAKTEISVAPTDERRVGFRVFSTEGVSGLRNFTARVRGGAELDLPLRLELIPRGRSVVWRADLDGDGAPEWILESSSARAVFSSQDGGRCLEFTWKDTNANFLPEAGLLAQPGPVEVRAVADGLEFTGKGWKRAVKLAGGELTIEQSEGLSLPQNLGGKRGNVSFQVMRPDASHAVLTLRTQ